MTSGPVILQARAISKQRRRSEPPRGEEPVPPARAGRLHAPPSRTRSVPHLFDCWDDVSPRIRAAKELRLFLDFDGTLVDFRARPDQVRLGDRARSALRALANHQSAHVAVVSGRRRASLVHFVKVPRVRFFGLYGWENEQGFHLPQATRRIFSQVRAMLAGLPAKAPGIYIEDKDLSLAVHFWAASPQARRRARAWLRKSVERFSAHLRVIPSGNVWEIVPRQVRGKGVAVQNMLRTLRTPFLPVYVGDDLTDEAAFKVLRDGITVHVGPRRRTNARFWLRNADEVCSFLERLEAELP
jgi:trehalose 6-phosphate phosphatase